MIHGSLFSGIGGFDLAAQWAGWENAFHCEIDPFCNKILNFYWPNAKSYQDIKESDFTFWRGGIDVLTGGFPCQPFSRAGRRQGTADPRHLWPEMLRAIREIKPRWVVGENVRDLINWSNGLVFEQICSDVENEGYQVWPLLLPACGVNAPHKRERIWFIAYAYGISGVTKWEEDKHSQQGGQAWGQPNGTTDKKNAANSGGKGLQGQQFIGTLDAERQIRGEQPSGPTAKFYKIDNWQQFPSISPICSGNDGLSIGLDGTTFSKWRNGSIKSFGNAIVPQVAFKIFKSINDFEQ